MFNEIVRLEIRQQLRSPVFWLALLSLGAYSAWGINDVSRLLARPGVYANASMLTVQLIALVGFANTVFIPLFIAQAMLRDIEHDTAPLIYATAVSRFDYVLGRFFAGYAVALIVPAFCLLVILASPFAPWVDAHRIGPTPWHAFGWAFCILVAPNTLLLCACMGALASRTRSLKSMYVGLIGFMAVRFGIVGALSHQGDGSLAVFLDPSAAKPIIDAILLGTNPFVNRNVPPLQGALCLNRVIWLCVSAILVAATYLSFRRNLPAERTCRLAPGIADARRPTGWSSAPQRFHRWMWLSQVGSLCRLDLMTVLRSPSFVVLVFICLLSTCFNLGYSAGADGVLPTTRVVLGSVHQALHWPLYIAVGFYAGDLAWRARLHHFATASDAYPVDNTAQLLGQLLALAAVIGITVLSCTLAGLGWQLSHEAPEVPIVTYAVSTCLTVLPYLYFAVLALFLQALTHHRYAGYALSGLCLVIFEVVLPQYRLDNPLWTYGHLPAQSISDVTGFFPTLPVALAYALYWSAGAAVLFVLACLCRVRGEDAALRLRWLHVRQRLGKSRRWEGAVSLALFIGIGAAIWTNQVTPQFNNEEAASYEILYGKYAALPQPRISSISLDVGIYPDRHRALVEGTYELSNTSTTPIQDLVIQYGRSFALDSVTLASQQALVADKRLGFFVYRLKEALAPGQTLAFGFKLSHEDPSLPTWQSQVLVPGNGVFFTNAELPRIGYQPRLEVTDPSMRAKFGLQSSRRNLFSGDASNLLGNDADWLTYRATLSTIRGQVALTSGRLASTWTAGGRVFYRYVSDAPMLNMMPFLFGAYASTATHAADTLVTVYHTPAHSWNTDGVLHAAKDSLSTYAALWGAYPHRQLTLVEVSGHTSAQSFPGIIVLPEVEMFSAKKPDANGTDTPYFAVAHEVAHQWWGHQVIAADAPGFDVLTESMAQYSALSVLERTHSLEAVDATLRDMLKSYSLGHGTNMAPELPLVETIGQPYVAYNKGPLALRAIAEHVGQEQFTHVLQQFFREERFKANPYPSTSKLVQQFLSAWQDAPSRQLIDELFKSVALYNLQILSARSTLRADGQYEVTLDIQGTRIERAPAGDEKSTPISVPVDLAILEETASGKPGKEIARERIRLDPSGHQTHFTFATSGKPAFAVLDSHYLLLNQWGLETSAPIVAR